MLDRADAPPAAPDSVVAPPAPRAGQSQSGKTSTLVMDDEHVRDPFIIASGSSYIVVLNHSVTIGDSGDTEELATAKGLHSKIGGGDLIWFKHEGKEYVIRDRATIDRAHELYKPIHELGAQQDELGKQQDELGKQQDALGDQMEEVKVKIPDMTADLDRIKERMREIAEKGGTQSEIGDLQSELGELQSRIGEIQSQAGHEQSKIGRQQGELGRRQGELGRRQGELGRKQGELSRKATQQVESILDDARAKGLAQPE
jgi:DNA repair exonuclease SbcCD ATPase subunit